MDKRGQYSVGSMAHLLLVTDMGLCSDTNAILCSRDCEVRQNHNNWERRE